jgi:hypothetical protein
MRTIIAAPFALAFGIACAQAQAIYRCGDSYGSQPCSGGKAIATETPEPTAAERRQAAGAAQRDARLADHLEQERLKQEARPAQVYAPPPVGEIKPEPHKWPEKAATRRLDVFTATAPGSAPARKASSGKGKAGDKGKGKAASTESAKPAKDSKTRPPGSLASTVRR